jgi:lycopene beta-cyclase
MKKHQLCQSKVTDINELENHAYVATETDSYTCDTIFNSIYDKEGVESQTKYPVLQQHFIGWFIKKRTCLQSRPSYFYGFSVEQKAIPLYVCCQLQPPKLY